jgi:mycothiol S-conjugate amidase
MSELCLMTVHAHPDDESSKGAPTVAKYHAEGVRTVLVCCTGGEEGDILNPALQGQPGIKENIKAIRQEELARAAEIIGYDEVVMLGYRDSGMPGTEANARPESFAQADLDEAVGRLVAVIRRTRPQVLIAYPQEQSGYPHPDHIRAHEIAAVAFDAAADPARFAEAGEPWQISKLYYTLWSVKRMLAIHEQFIALGKEPPWPAERVEQWRNAPEHEPTTRIDISGLSDVRDKALLAHETQVDPNSQHWFGLDPEAIEELHHWDEYDLARDLTGTTLPEADLFAGLREPAEA